MPPKNIPHHPKPPASTVSTASTKSSKHGKAKKHKSPTTLWQEAYDALAEDEKGKERLQKLSNIIKDQIGKPKLKIRSDDGYAALSSLIQEKAKKLEDDKSSDKVDKITSNMMMIQDLVGAAAGVGGPYVALPAAALFLAFSVSYGMETSQYLCQD